MKEELFTELLESVHEGGAILRAEMSPSRRSTFEKLDVQQIRANHLQVAAKCPEAVWDVVKPKKKLADKKSPRKTKKNISDQDPNG
jgi:hypothetical protein